MKPQSRQRGSVLIVAMVVLFALASLALTLNRTARTDLALGANTQASGQADAIERGAEQYVLALLTEYRDTLNDLTESEFAQVPVGDGYFWIIKPTYGDSAEPIYGLTDEAAKFNLNTANYERMRLIPGMTDEIAGAIVDWRDEDEQVSSSGAESTAYSGQNDGYMAKNANFEAVEELMLVKGMTRQLLYGDPTNSERIIGNDYYVTHGLFDFFTIWTTQPNTAADGTARVNINSQQSREQLRQLIITKVGAGRGNQIAGSIQGTVQYQDVFDLAFRTSMTYDEFSKVEDFITSAGGAAGRQRPGLINVNTAPREVLVAMGLTESDADAVISRRISAATDTPNTYGWVYDVLKDKAVGIGNQITGKSLQYSADIVAANRTGRAFKHVRIVVDASQSPAKIVYRRDLTQNGWPMDPSILSQLKAGQAPTSSNSLVGGVR